MLKDITYTNLDQTSLNNTNTRKRLLIQQLFALLCSFKLLLINCIIQYTPKNISVTKHFHVSSLHFLCVVHTHTLVHINSNKRLKTKNHKQRFQTKFFILFYDYYYFVIPQFFCTSLHALYYFFIIICVVLCKSVCNICKYALFLLYYIIIRFLQILEMFWLWTN